MELFATLLFMCSMFAGLAFVIMLIVSIIKKKPKKKLYTKGLLISVAISIVSIVLFGVFQTPESRAKYEQQRIETEKEKKIKEQEKKDKDSDEKGAYKNSASSDGNNSFQNSTDTVKRKEINLDYLKQLKIRENPVMNGIKTEKIGMYGFVKADKELACEIEEQEYIEFCNECVRDSGYNWFTIDFGDGTGIVFAGSIPETGTYGELDEDRCLIDIINYITINEDNTVSLSAPPEY